MLVYQAHDQENLVKGQAIACEHVAVRVRIRVHSECGTRQGPCMGGHRSCTHRDALDRLHDAVFGRLVVGEVRSPQPLEAALHVSVAG